MYKPAKRFRWHRFGDLSMENGGGFYSFEGWPHYVDVIRVTPCSDAGGPDNQFWLERGTIFMGRKPEELKNARSIFGMDEDDYKKLSRATKRHFMAEAVLAAHGMDRDAHWTVQIGAEADNHQPGFDPITIDEVLRGNCSLEKYVYEKRHG